MKRVMLTLLATLTMALGLTVAVGAPAEAATSCSGSLIGRTPIKYSGSTIGELVVYYNSSTGKNCARTNHLGATYGVKRTTEVSLVRCTQRTHQDQFCTPVESTEDHQKDNFAYYAGPVYVYAPRNCVKAVGIIDWKGSYRTVSWVGGC